MNTGEDKHTHTGEGVVYKNFEGQKLTLTLEVLLMLEVDFYIQSTEEARTHFELSRCTSKIRRALRKKCLA